MEFDNEFTVPVPPEEAWTALMDVDRVAQCMPGATLLDNDGQRFTGRVKVKVGPITVSYRGTAQFTETDREAGRAVLTAKGREERGAGTAGMTVSAQLEPAPDDTTRVRVHTELDITGKPAQFGRGVMAEVGTAILEQFAERLARELATEEATAPPSPAATPEATPSGPASDEGALDLGSLAWAPLARRALPVAAAAAGLLAGTLLALRRRNRLVIVVIWPEQRQA